MDFNIIQLLQHVLGMLQFSPLTSLPPVFLVIPKVIRSNCANCCEEWPRGIYTRPPSDSGELCVWRSQKTSGAVLKLNPGNYFTCLPFHPVTLLFILP